MTWKQLLDWANDPARTKAELRDAITALEGSGISVSKGGSYKNRLTSAIAAHPDLTAAAPWTPAGYTPPTPVPAPAPTPQPAAPQAPTATATAAQVTPQPVVVETPIEQQQAQPQATTALPVHAAPTAVATNTERSFGMKALAGALVAAVAIIALAWIVINQPWDNNGGNNVVTQGDLDNLKDDILKAIPSNVSTPAPTVVYQTPSNNPAPAAPAPAQTPSSSLGVPVPAANCWTTGEAKSLTGVDVQRIGTEPCAWVWRAVGVGATTAQCPAGALCTFDTGNGIVVDMGAGSRTIVAGTWRKVDSYPETDAVHRPCELLAKEQQFGRQEDPSFTVHAGNGLNCGDTSTNSAPQSNNDSANSSSCPSSAEEAASMVGGDAGSWNRLSGFDNGWKYIGGMATLKVPQTAVLDYPSGRAQAGQQITATEATLWCPA